MFKNVESALSWAYMMSSMDLIEPPAMNRLSWKNEGCTSIDFLQGIGRADQIKQAQAIVGMVDKLTDPVYAELIRAEFGAIHSMDSLVIRVIGTLGTGVHRRRGIQDLILKYCGANITARTVRDHLKCNANEVRAYESKIYDVLDRYRSSALDLLNAEMEEKGLIEIKESKMVNC